MTLQAKIPDLPRPAFVAPCGSTLRPAAIVAAVAGHKNREITSSVSPCALALVLCGAVTLLRSHSSACPCYHHSTLECLIVSRVSLCPACSLSCLSTLLLLCVLAALSCLLLPPPSPLLSSALLSFCTGSHCLRALHCLSSASDSSCLPCYVCTAADAPALISCVSESDTCNCSGSLVCSLSDCPIFPEKKTATNTPPYFFVVLRCREMDVL